MNSLKVGRNDPCHCGSGLKYKKCCNAKDEAARSAELSAQAAARAEEAAAKAEAEAKAESDEAEAGSAKTAKGAAKKEGGEKPRPKLPSHHTSLPRRGSA